MSLDHDDKVLACTRVEDASIVLKGYAEVACEECGSACLITETGQEMIAAEGFKVGCLPCIRKYSNATGQEPEPMPERWAAAQQREYDRAMTAIAIRDSMKGR